MNFNSAQSILAIIAIILAVVGIIRPAWPCVSVAVLLLAIAFLIGK